MKEKRFKKEMEVVVGSKELKIKINSNQELYSQFQIFTVILTATKNKNSFLARSYNMESQIKSLGVKKPTVADRYIRQLGNMELVYDGINDIWKVYGIYKDDEEEE